MKEVPTANVSNHSLHCYRNLFCCAVCKSVIPIRDRDAHMSAARGTKCAAALRWRDRASPYGVRVRSEALVAACEAGNCDVVLLVRVRVC